ncbi:fungal chitosanase of glycosyl hydrolase group 75-domain-containing protein, partial [Mycena rosella]
RRDAVAFRADPAASIEGILIAAQASQQKSLGSFPSSTDASKSMDILGDWLNLDGVSAFFFLAGMNGECGEVVSDPASVSGDVPGHSLGHLDTAQVPYFVLPETFVHQYADIIEPNAVGAIVCNGQMLYGILGDTNAATPEVIGEGSLLLAKTCFLKERLNGRAGHTALDVLYIVFGTRVLPGDEGQTIDIGALKQAGDEQVGVLQSTL